LTGTAFTQLNVVGGDRQMNFAGLTGSVSQFFNLVQANNWIGLANYMRQGDDTIVGTKNNDTLMGGAGDDTFSSGTGRDLINGGAGNDTMEAMGGHDVMSGGGGADQFQFAAEPMPGEDWWVTIKDFRHGVDRIAVSDTAFNHVGFGGFSGAVMDASHLKVGTAATTAEQGMVYDRAKGLLYSDADGSGTQADQVLLAKLVPGTLLTAGDFWVI